MSAQGISRRLGRLEGRRRPLASWTDEQLEARIREISGQIGLDPSLPYDELVAAGWKALAADGFVVPPGVLP